MLPVPGSLVVGPPSAPVLALVGPRSLPAAFASAVAAVVRSALAAGCLVASSCCPSGAPAFARSACASACASPVVFSRSFAGRAAFAARAAALVRWSASGPAGSSLVAFVARPCPAGIAPAPRWRSGSPPSGSWSELALAAGLGLPVVVVWCAPGPAALPAWPGFSWSPAAPGFPVAGAWCLVPCQLPLISI